MTTPGRFAWVAGDVVVHPPTAEPRSMGRFTMRDWTQWDLEHPYVPHPKEANPHMDQLVTARFHDVKGIDDPELKQRAMDLSKDEIAGTTIDLTGIHPKAQEGVIQSLEIFHGTYPAIPINVRTETPQSDPHALEPNISADLVGKGSPPAVSQSWAMASTQSIGMTLPNPNGPDGTNRRAEGGSQIVLNKDYFADPRVLSDHEQASIAARYLTDGVAAPLLDSTRDRDYTEAAHETMDHELGHALMNDNGLLVSARNAETGMRVNPNGIAAQVSQYATENKAEFLAECFAQSRGSSPSRMAIETVKSMDAAYHNNHYHFDPAKVPA